MAGFNLIDPGRFWVIANMGARELTFTLPVGCPGVGFEKSVRDPRFVPTPLRVRSPAIKFPP